MRPFPAGIEILGKATRNVDERDPLNPDGELMQAHERRLKREALTALRNLREALFDGVTDETVHSVVQRLDNEQVVIPFRDRIIAALQRIALDGADFGRRQIEREVFGVKRRDAGGFSIDWQLANNAAAAWAQRYGYDLVRGILDTTRQRLRREVAQFIQNQENIGQLTARLTDAFGPVRAELIAVTETTRAFAEGNMASWRESGVVEQRQWRTNNDELVCPICGPLADQVAGLDEAFGVGIDAPPAHPRCRCWLVPHVELPA